MREITLTADDRLIAAAEERARQEHSTLDEQFQRWLTEYVQQNRHEQAQRAMRTVRELQKYARTGGRRFTREEMNER